MANDLVIAANISGQALALARTSVVSSARRPAAPDDAGRHRDAHLELDDEVAFQTENPPFIDPVFGPEPRGRRLNAAFLAQLIGQQDRTPRLTVDQTQAATRTYERASKAGSAAGVDLTV